MTSGSTRKNPAIREASEGDLPLICPVCAQPLSWGDRACLCAQGHSFDLAKEGYANLLLSHHRRTKSPGDSAEMVQARRRFFDSDAFAQLSTCIQDEVRRLIAGWDAQRKVTILDSGCGEGHFLGALQDIVADPAYGVDVSKDAIRLAARRYKDSRWVVANAMRHMPFADNSLDIVLSVLAPRKVAELARVLKPDGFLLVVVPGPNHLLQLRSRLTADARDFQAKADAAVEFCASRFALDRKESLTYEVLLGRELLTDLVQMTPLFWRSTRAAKADLSRLAELRVAVDFVLLTFALNR
ncbi:MAG: methyltransferase domain-containing protein [Victivallales bacterium]|nr:methyltransferase domain-containing protein [Victivallales bacterium]